MLGYSCRWEAVEKEPICGRAGQFAGQDSSPASHAPPSGLFFGGGSMKYGWLILLFPSLCFAGDWTATDTTYQAAYTTLLAMDCAQTRYGASHPGRFEEVNPLLGKHPSKGRINNTCAAIGLGHFGVSYILPLGARRLWQSGGIIIEGYAVLHNKSIGVKMEF